MKTIHPPRQLPAQAYDGLIEAVDCVSFDWRRSSENPDGLCLRLAVLVHADDGEAHIFDAIDVTNVARLRAVYEAAGLPVPGNPVADSHGLVGRSARVTVKNIVPKAGKHCGIAKAVCGSWISCR